MGHSTEPDTQHLHRNSVPLSTRLKEVAQLFLRLGAIGFGGPQAPMAMIHDEAVVRRGWFQEEQFLEGVALGELTPGPVVITAAFVGYKVAGVLGALVATVAIFLSPHLAVGPSRSPGRAGDGDVCLEDRYRMSRSQGSWADGH
ncbi:MAG: chromate transporter [Leptolyngbya sp. LCM1.Bin17]|nr:MAG: chromate transporter [Leptolyngbya sp. LCM1.Bin17]